MSAKKFTVPVLAVLAIFLAIAGFSAMKGDEMSTRISLMPMKTLCVGRFLIDVPEHGVVTFGSTTISGWRITNSYGESEAEFEEELREKEGDLAKKRNERGLRSLEKVVDFRGTSVSGKIFVFDRKWSHGYEHGKRVDHVTVAVHGLVKNSQGAFSFESDYVFPDEIGELSPFMQKFRTFAEDEIPKGSGFCFERSMVADPLVAAEHESTVMFVGLPEHPDLSIAIYTLAGPRPTASLLERDAQSPIKRRYGSRFHSFRRGERNVNGFLGQEILERVHEMNGVKAHSFRWEVAGMADDVMKPEIDVEMSTSHGRPGEPVQPSLSDAEALALWDKILSSLRPRPVIKGSVAPAP